MRAARAACARPEKNCATTVETRTSAAPPIRAAASSARSRNSKPSGETDEPDEVWENAAKHFEEPELAAIVLWIATTNFFNRINVTTHQPAPQNWG